TTGMISRHAIAPGNCSTSFPTPAREGCSRSKPGVRANVLERWPWERIRRIPFSRVVGEPSAGRFEGNETEDANGNQRVDPAVNLHRDRRPPPAQALFADPAGDHRWARVTTDA